MSFPATKRVLRSSKNKSAPSGSAAGSSLDSTAASGPFNGPLSPRSLALAASKPSLPVEILTEIFTLALTMSTDPSTPFKSPASPYKPFASLLAASRYSGASPSRSSTGPAPSASRATFSPSLGARSGVFVVGYDLDQKRAALKEICLVEEVDFPLDLGALNSWCLTNIKPLDPRDGDDRARLELSNLGVTRLTLLSLSTQDALATSAANREELQRLIVTGQKDDRVRQMVTRAEKDDPPFRGPGKVSLKDAVAQRIIEAHPYCQQMAMLRFLRALKPSIIRLSPSYSSRLATAAEGSYAPVIYHDKVVIMTFCPSTAQRATRNPFLVPTTISSDFRLQNASPSCIILDEEAREAAGL